MRHTLAISVLLATSSLAFADVKVITSIKPVHSLVASVMAGVGEPGVLVTGADSPHTYSLKPSDASALQDARVVFWIGHELEPFLEKPLESLEGKAKVVSLLDAKSVQKLPVREGNNFDKHEHHSEAGHDHEHDHHSKAEHDHKHDHAEGASDAHIWLDPDNAKAMVTAIAKTLSSVDPPNAKVYKDNAAKTRASIDAVDKEIQQRIAPAKGKGFIVFHDAYQYFENHFGLSAAGAISINPENPPGAKGIAEIRKRLSDGKVQCVFAEPQFDNKLVNVIVDGTNVRTGTLDPEGATLEPSPQLYTQLMQQLATGFTQCLAP